MLGQLAPSAEPGWSPGHFLHIGASLVTQTVKNLPAVQETWVQSLGQEDPFEKESNPLQYSCLENSCGQKSLVGCKQSMDSESNTTEATKQQQQHGLSQDIRYSSLCTIAGPCFLSILYEFASANP